MVGLLGQPLTFIYPRAPSTFLEGVWGGFRGSKYLLRRYLEPLTFRDVSITDHVYCSFLYIEP